MRAARAAIALEPHETLHIVREMVRQDFDRAASLAINYRLRPRRNTNKRMTGTAMRTTQTTTARFMGPKCNAQFVDREQAISAIPE